MPQLFGWEDDGTSPWLAIEDLSAATWPPPWAPGQVDAVLATLRAVAATPAGALESCEAHRAEFAGWPLVAKDAGPFLGLGVADERWLAGALPVLLATQGRAELDGEAMLHNDVRSDNLCFTHGRVVLVDWNWATRGNPKLDVAAWLPSLAREGGPLPEAILPDEPELASFVAGFYAAHAGLPPPRPGMEALRALQLDLLRTSLAWAARALGLPAPDGLNG
jgi:aminoglycoside phosphotransferase (APT) family kinase protein